MLRRLAYEMPSPIRPRGSIYVHSAIVQLQIDALNLLLRFFGMLDDVNPVPSNIIAPVSTACSSAADIPDPTVWISNCLFRRTGVEFEAILSLKHARDIDNPF